MMTEQKLRQVLDRYSDWVDERNFPYSDTRETRKIQDMLPKMYQFLATGRREKLMRWLGFVQGILWQIEAFTLEELKSHNRPDEDNAGDGISGS